MVHGFRGALAGNGWFSFWLAVVALRFFTRVAAQATAIIRWILTSFARPGAEHAPCRIRIAVDAIASMIGVISHPVQRVAAMWTRDRGDGRLEDTVIMGLIPDKRDGWCR